MVGFTHRIGYLKLAENMSFFLEEIRWARDDFSFSVGKAETEDTDAVPEVKSEAGWTRCASSDQKQKASKSTWNLFISYIWGDDIDQSTVQSEVNWGMVGIKKGNHIFKLDVHRVSQRKHM